MSDEPVTEPMPGPFHDLLQIDQSAMEAWTSAPRETPALLPLSRGDVDQLLFSIRRLQDALVLVTIGLDPSMPDSPEAAAVRLGEMHNNLKMSMDSLTLFMNSVFAKAADIGNG